MTEKHENVQPINNRDEKILGLLGLAARAGRLVCGAEKIVDAVRTGSIGGRGNIIIIAADASARTKKNITLAAADGEVRCAEIGADMYTLGHRTGGKGAASAVAVIDRNMASALEKLI